MMHTYQYRYGNMQQCTCIYIYDCMDDNVKSLCVTPELVLFSPFVIVLKIYEHNIVNSFRIIFLASSRQCYCHF